MLTRAHPPVVHCFMTAGVGLERAFGFWRTCLLYMYSGLLGTVLSTVFLPGVLSVGASGSMFGLVSSAALETPAIV